MSNGAPSSRFASWLDVIMRAADVEIWNGYLEALNTRPDIWYFSGLTQNYGASPRPYRALATDGAGGLVRFDSFARFTNLTTGAGRLGQPSNPYKEMICDFLIRIDDFTLIDNTNMWLGFGLTNGTVRATGDIFGIEWTGDVPFFFTDLNTVETVTDISAVFTQTVFHRVIFRCRDGQISCIIDNTVFTHTTNLPDQNDPHFTLYLIDDTTGAMAIDIRGPIIYQVRK